MKTHLRIYRILCIALCFGIGVPSLLADDTTLPFVVQQAKRGYTTVQEVRNLSGDFEVSSVTHYTDEFMANLWVYSSTIIAPAGMPVGPRKTITIVLYRPEGGQIVPYFGTRVDDYTFPGSRRISANTNILLGTLPDWNPAFTSRIGASRQSTSVTRTTTSYVYADIADLRSPYLSGRWRIEMPYWDPNRGTKFRFSYYPPRGEWTYMEPTISQLRRVGNRGMEYCSRDVARINFIRLLAFSRVGNELGSR